MKKTIAISVLLGLVLTVFFSGTVSAETAQDAATASYSYWLGYNEKTQVYTKPLYDVETVLYGEDFGYDDFSKPSDVFCTEQGDLYIVESGTSRLTVLDSALNLKNSITEFIDSENNSYDFFGANGVFVDGDGIIYIADTLNARILMGDLNGRLLECRELPESTLIPEDFIYQPTKVVVDNKGFMYVISSGSVYGALCFTRDGDFQGFYGSNTVTADVATALKSIWNNFFATDEQLQGQVQKIPYQFTDICLDSADFAYTVTGTTDLTDTNQVGQIRCLNPKGKNILKVKQTEKYSDTDSFNFGDTEVADQSTGSGYRLLNFVSLDVDSNGFMYALDSTYGRIYLYDKECNLLCAFAGGMGEGEKQGTFVTPNSIAVCGDRIFVSDDSQNSITVFKLNSYGALLKEADSLYLNGNYSESKDLWLQVNAEDPNCQLAYHGLAKAYLIEKDYDNALFYAEQGLDYLTYNQAFGQVRNVRLKSFFGAALIILVVLIAAIIVVLSLRKKGRLNFSLNKKVKLYLTSFIHPFEFANQIKFNKQGSLICAVISLVAFYAFKVLDTTNGGFLFSRFDAHSYNALYTFIGSVGVVLLWTVCYWAVAVLFSGKCKLSEVFIVSSYAMLPQIINGIFYLIASNVLLLEESTVLTAVNVIMLILSGIVLCIGSMVCSEYGFFKFVGVALVTVIGVCLVIFVVFMILTLDQQLITFLQSIFKEVIYR